MTMKYRLKINKRLNHLLQLSLFTTGLLYWIALQCRSFTFLAILHVCDKSSGLDANQRCTATALCADHKSVTA